MIYKSFKILLICILAVFASDISCTQHLYNKNRIQPYSQNPFYWQYKGKPVLLLGGSWQDNLFNHPFGLADHLDKLVECGGNYVRNTMSTRESATVFAYKESNGLYDLNEFNPEYWQRFDNFLSLTSDRDIIVQIEVFDPHDFFVDIGPRGGWSRHPFNPKNNINYTAEESGLPTIIDYHATPEPSDHPFYQTIPVLKNNELVLSYQRAFVDKMLSISLKYPNVLYCIQNESGEELAFGDYWADYIHNQVRKSGKTAIITDMRRSREIDIAGQHHYIFSNPQRYNFVDISQNNWQSGQKHYDRILYVRKLIAGDPRPMNCTKIYSGRGQHNEAVARFFRIIFAGGASARFHRPYPLEDIEAHEKKSDTGLGLSPIAQSHIKSARMLTNSMNIFTCTPRNDLLGEKSENEAYCLAEPKEQYALYFPDGGQVILDLSDSEVKWQLKWLNISESNWLKQKQILQGGRKVQIKTPGVGHWAALILPAD